VTFLHLLIVQFDFDFFTRTIREITQNWARPLRDASAASDGRRRVMGVRRSNIFRAQPFVITSLLRKLRFIEHPDTTAPAARLAAEFPRLDLEQRSTRPGRIHYQFRD
jgi:hypothetical protein